MEDRWYAPVWLYPCLLLGSGCILALRSFLARRSAAPRLPPTFLEFQRKFLTVFFLALATHILQNVYAEAQYKSYGFRRKDIALLLLVGHVTALFLGNLCAISADFLGRKQMCRAYAIFTLIESFLKQWGHFHTLCFARVFNGLGASLWPCVFEAWMISEHEKHGFRQEWMGDTFLMLSFGGAVVSLGATAAANIFVTSVPSNGAPSFLAAGAALIVFVLVSRSWNENSGDDGQVKTSKSLLQVMRDKRVLALGVVQASFDISLSVFWLLWIPTIVADGREIHAGSIYICLMGSVILGTSISAIILSNSLFSPEKALSPLLVISSFCLLIPAYDYQEISVLVASFCVFHICVGVATPLLSRSRAICVSSSRRVGVYAMYRVPVDILLMIFLIRGSLLQNLDNSTILYTCCLANLAAAGAMYMLNTSLSGRKS